MEIMNIGGIDMGKVRNLARMAGISDDELDAALAANNITGLAFATGGMNPH